MGRHRKQKKVKAPRPKGSERTELIMAVVKTDNTFEPVANGWLGKCIHCSSKIYVGNDGRTPGTLEHILPINSGGTNVITNLALACATCNNDKGIRHDLHVGKRGRADEVISALQEKRMARFRES